MLINKIFVVSGQATKAANTTQTNEMPHPFDSPSVNVELSSVEKTGKQAGEKTKHNQ